MSTEPVTVILCVYNGERYLDQTIRSVRAQTYEHWSLLVVDDGSTDRSAEIAGAHAGEDARIRVIRQANTGVSRARNHALREATTRWVALLDHDDLFLPEKLSRQMTFLANHPEVVVLGTHGYRIGSRGQRLGVFDVGPQDAAHFGRLYERGGVIYLLAASVVFDRELALTVGGFPQLPPAEDVALWSRMADHGVVLALPERLVGYRILGGSASSRTLHRQRLLTRMIADNNRRRRSAQPEQSFEEFQARWDAQPLRVVRAFERESDSLNAYRLAGSLLADRQPIGLYWLARSVALNPLGRLRRVATQLNVKGRFNRKRGAAG